MSGRNGSLTNNCQLYTVNCQLPSRLPVRLMEDFKEVAYFAVSLVLAAFIITLVALLGQTTVQMASIRHGELDTAESLVLARTYSPYDNQLVTGGDVIALLRENVLSGGLLSIYVDRNANGLSMTMNAANFGSTSWRLGALVHSIKADAVYRAILVYDHDNPATAAYTVNRVSVVTGIKFTAS